jgi:acyl-coenzyme A synthetase/AMP-(fatty) acid ligase
LISALDWHGAWLLERPAALRGYLLVALAGVWMHGDCSLMDGMWYILGRSDDTIKVAGKRLGPAEVESILVSHPNVIEAAVIGVPDEIKVMISAVSLEERLRVMRRVTPGTTRSGRKNLGLLAPRILFVRDLQRHVTPK